MAAWQAFARQILEQAHPKIIVSSAGLSALPNEPASLPTMNIARDWGIDLGGHRARRLTDEIARDAALICTMTASQAATVAAHFNLDPACVHLLGAFAPVEGAAVPDSLARLLRHVATAHFQNSGVSPDILDPYGGSVEAYQTCAAQIRHAVLGLARALREGHIDEYRIH
ncbi:MAG: hypothetical protein M3347_08565 [Armatimonadota bacterium]|nr:hypothetical protein [Armatimonadota bacterium]